MPVENPWRQRDAFGDLVLEMRKAHAVNIESTATALAEEIRVRHQDGRTLLNRKVTIRTQTVGRIEAAFSDDGLAVVITTSDGRDRVWPLEKLGFR